MVLLLTLTLLVSRFFADHTHATLSPNNPAIPAILAIPAIQEIPEILEILEIPETQNP